MLQSENKQVKYKSDKVLYPLLALWFIVNLGLHFLSNQIFGLISVILWGSTIFGVNIYRSFKEPFALPGT
ncbi:Na+/H+ antiporter NhaB [Pedobacter cryoconitis]|uniref:Na+/H+ antiporter NhaB n=1 Tax=Pedobacter cryoconitis TaxID=188932 RepID=A0A7W8ZJT7_9SPHI|nr:Na+/H+ antiporter NhaB [Pedobacter cryoconitis]